MVIVPTTQYINLALVIFDPELEMKLASAAGVIGHRYPRGNLRGKDLPITRRFARKDYTGMRPRAHLRSGRSRMEEALAALLRDPRCPSSP